MNVYTKQQIETAGDVNDKLSKGKILIGEGPDSIYSDIYSIYFDIHIYAIDRWRRTYTLMTKAIQREY